MIGIYKITNPKRKVYIGQSINIERRFKQYLKSSLQKYSQTKLYNSFKKYGLDSHTFEILEECNFEELNNKERFYQDKYNVLSKNGLNCILISTDLKPSLFSKETREKMSKSKIGIKCSEETRLKISKSNTGRKVTGKNYEIFRNAMKKRSKPIIDTKTNKIWYSLRECAKENNITKSTLNNYLLNKTKNKTSLIYLNNL